MELKKGTLNWLQTFHSVATCKSFSQASTELNLARSVITDHISKLEEQYGVKLINRTTRSFALTDEGDELLNLTQKVFQSVLEAHGFLSGLNEQNSGKLSIKIPPVLDTPKFHNLLTRYKKDNPGIIFDIYLDNNIGDLVKEKIDLAFALGQLKDSEYIARKMIDINTFVLASPAYWREYGKPQNPLELANHKCINYRHCKTGAKWQFTRESEILDVEIGETDICDSDEMLISFASAGLGVVTALGFTCVNQMNSQELETALEDWTSHISLYALLPSRSNLPRRTRNFLDSFSILMSQYF